MTPQRLSVVIRSFNEERHIGRLLTGILRQSVPTPDIVLADSGSRDATVAIASRYPVRVVHIAPQEFTFGRSLNRGIAAAKGDVVVLASAHVYPRYDDWLERLTAPLRDTAVALAYGKQRGDEVTRFSERQLFRAWFPEQSNAAQDTPFCNNANAAIRRSLWEEMPYDETLTGLEDVDWALRAQLRGLRVAYVAEAEVAHVHEESVSRVYNRYRREAIALKRIFPDQGFGLGDFVRLLMRNVASDLGTAWRERAVSRHGADIVRFRCAQLWGTYRGFAQRRLVDEALRRRFYYPGVEAAAPESAASPARLIDYSEARQEEYRGAPAELD
jgi:rhamnosyltransferase